MKKLLVFGAGGHAKVVIDIARLMGYQVVAVFDDNEQKHGQFLWDIPIKGNQQALIALALQEKNTHFFIALGNNSLRLQLAQKFQQAGLQAATLIHPSAVIASYVSIGSGTVIMAGVCINSDANIGEQVIVNTSAVVEHDCMIGDAVHIAPTVALCGAVSIGAKSLIGVGAKVIPCIKIGNVVTVGAGAVVVNNIPDNQTVVGVPAKVLGN